MQTFLPYPDFVASARCLDRARLGKQRLEVLQILRVTVGLTKGWRNHPSVLMWWAYPQALSAFGVACCKEWTRRGYRDGTLQSIRAFWESLEGSDYNGGACPGVDYPPWWDDERVFAGYRANLLRKDPGHYGQFGWTEDPLTPYYWPMERCGCSDDIVVLRGESCGTVCAAEKRGGAS